MKNESGIALMMVLASLVVMMSVVVDLAYNAHINYEVAAIQRDRLKAQYLALSAVTLIRYEIKSEQQLRQRFAGVISQLAGTDVSSEPFCKSFPLSSGLIQGLASGQLGSGGKTDADAASEVKTGEKKMEKKVMPKGTEEAGMFDLGGDFEGSCDTEERKINLNAFWQGATPQEGNAAGPAVYEQQKALLFSLLSHPDFEPIFGSRRDEVQRVVNAIADWADADDRVNEAPGLSGDYEESLYKDLTYKPKNGKYATSAELLLIPGVGDDLYRLLAPSITVFGDNKINLCQAAEAVVVSFLVHYSTTTPGASPFKADDETRKKTLLDAIGQACQQPNPQAAQIANAITSILGGTGGAATGSGGPALAQRISTTNRFYTIQAVGSSGESVVTIRLALDMGDPNVPKVLYYRVE